MRKQSLTVQVPTGKFDKCGSHSAAVEGAAQWLHEHRSEIVGAVIPILKERFGLRNIEAIEATKLAHALDFGGSIN